MDKVMFLLKKYSPIIFGLLFSLIWVFLADNTVNKIDRQVTDKLWQWISSTTQLEQRLIIIDIDEASIMKYGAWPWERQRIAMLSKKIHQHGVKLQIFDMVFAQQKQGDEQLIAQFQQQDTVLSQVLAINADDNTQLGFIAGGINNPHCHKQYPQLNAYIANNATISTAVNTVGHITPRIDSDGLVRKLPAFICQQETAYPTLALTALAVGSGQAVDYQYQQNKGWLQPVAQLNLKQLPEITIPLNQQGEITLPWWLAKSAFISISASDILDDKVPDQLLTGAWVIISSTAFGAGDAVPTPLAGITAGVEVHTQLLSALLDNHLPYRPQGINIILTLWLVSIALAMAWLTTKKGRVIIYGAPLLAVLLIAVTVIIQAYLLINHQLLVSTVLPMSYSLLTGFFIAIKGYTDSWTETQRLYVNLSSYLPEHAAKWIAKQDPISSLAVHHEHAFVMYVDLRNFTNWCNQLPAEEIGAILHTFYKTVNEVVNNYGGETEKYIGDAVLCVWRNQDHSILQAATTLFTLIDNELGVHNDNESLPPLSVGIGIEQGTILVGSLGPAQRREYTVIGKAVTTAIHLQEMTTELALPILIGENAAKHWQTDIALETQGQFLLAGANAPIEIFTPANEVTV